jgi:hypothetical protein
MTDERELPEGVESEDASEEAATKRRRPWWQRTLIGLAIAAGVLGLLALLLYNFGGMMPPSAEAKAQYQILADAGQAPPVDSRFHIPIPGCVCHSDNPVLQMQHSTRSLNQCMSCHGEGGVAAGQ